MRIFLPIVALLAVSACSEEAPPPPEQPTAEQVAAQSVPAEPLLPGTSELKGALIGGCPKLAMRLTHANCSETDEDAQFACTYQLKQDDAEHRATLAAEGEDWKLVELPEDCAAAA